ncbi:MAG: sulfatase-like hydrolase/transferase [Congregibacter sp.]
MKKTLLVLCLGLLVGGAIAWQQRVEIILALVKFKTSRDAADVGPMRELPWQQGPLTALAAAGDQQPNIILIVADDLGYNDISTFGGGVDGRLQTPGIDRLAAEGAIFRQSYSGASTCAPSRAMMMTGRYPTRTGFEFTPTPGGMIKTIFSIRDQVESNNPLPAFFDEEMDESQPPYEDKGLPASEITIAEVLKERGYYTAHIGKWHLGRQNGMAPHEQGFDDSLLMQSGLYLPEDHPDVVNAKLPFDAIDKFLWAGMSYAASFNSGNADRFEPGGYLTDYWTDESIKVIKANKNRPFFLYLAHWGPHTPLQATRDDYEAVGHIKPHRKRVYAAMVRAVDRSVSRILDTLDAEGIAENTLVVFTSDNGGAGYIGIPDINQPFRGWKITMFEGGLRVPLFMRWPARVAPGTRVDQPVAHIDVMPSLAAAARAPLRDDVPIDGENLLPLATGEGSNAWDRQTLFWQNGHYQVVRHRDWKLQINNRPTDGIKKWLYNLSDDPTEQINLAAAQPAIVAELEDLLEQHQAAARKPLYPPVLNSPQLVDKTSAEAYVEGDEYVYTPN